MSQLVRDHTGRLATKDIKRRPRNIFHIALAPLVTLFTQPIVLWNASLFVEPLNADEPEHAKQKFLLQFLCFTLRVATSPLSWNVQVKFLLLEIAIGRQMERIQETVTGVAQQ